MVNNLILINKKKEEVSTFFDVHEQEGSHPGGVHLEITCHDVTECIPPIGSRMLSELPRWSFTTHCDPRLNVSQSLELVSIIADRLSKRKMSSAE